MNRTEKILKRIVIISGILLLALLSLHTVGSRWNRRTPKGGINTSMYVDINGTREWINIYGKDKNNPVLLYLHGGPGSATSEIDYAFTRKWADIYTVVTWDQRNCGKSYDIAQNHRKLTKDILMEDGKELTEFLKDYLNVEKISLLGHSWGSIYGANLVLANPDDYDLFIGCGQLVDPVENEKAFIAEARQWAAGDEDTLKLLSKIDPESIDVESIEAKNAILKKYGYSIMNDKVDYNIVTTILFNPNYSLADWLAFFRRDHRVYFDFYCSDEFKAFSLKGRNTYRIPYININGDMDYQVSHKLAEDYFNQITAPQKDLFLMKNTRHGLLVSKSEEFSKLLHQVYEKYRWIYRGKHGY